MPDVLSCTEFLSALQDGEITIGDFSEKVKLAPILYKGKVLRIQTPQMPSTFGINLPFTPVHQKNSPPDPNANHTINLSFKDMDTRASLQKFMIALDKLSEGVINKAMERSIDWFKRKLDSASIRENFNSNVKKSMAKVEDPDHPGTFKYIQNDKYAPTFRCTLHRQNGAYTFDTCDDKYEPVDLSNYNTKGARFTAILKCTGVYVMNQSSFGISWKVEQMRVKPPAVSDMTNESQIGGQKTFSFRTDDDETNEMNEEDEKKKKVPRIDLNAKDATARVESS